jgi:predicted transcriptional regulator
MKGSEKMKITTSFCAEEELINKIRQQAEKENRNFSNLIETAIIDYLKNNDKR